MRRPTSTQECLQHEQRTYDKINTTISRFRDEIMQLEADEIELTGRQALRLSILRAGLDQLREIRRDVRANLRRARERLKSTLTSRGKNARF